MQKLSKQQEKVLFSSDDKGEVSYCGYATNPRTLRSLVSKGLIVQHYRYPSVYHLTKEGKDYVKQKAQTLPTEEEKTEYEDRQRWESYGF